MTTPPSSQHHKADSSSSPNGDRKSHLTMKSMPDLLSGAGASAAIAAASAYFRHSGTGGCGAKVESVGKSPSPPPDSLEDVSYIDMEDDAEENESAEAMRGLMVRV